MVVDRVEGCLRCCGFFWFGCVGVFFVNLPGQISCAAFLNLPEESHITVRNTMHRMFHSGVFM